MFSLYLMNTDYRTIVLRKPDLTRALQSTLPGSQTRTFTTDYDCHGTWGGMRERGFDGIGSSSCTPFDSYPRLKKLCHELGDERIPEQVMKWR